MQFYYVSSGISVKHFVYEVFGTFKDVALEKVHVHVQKNVHVHVTDFFF